MLALFSSGCAQGEVSAPKGETLTAEQSAALQKRVEQRWQSIIARDFDTTWEFSTPTFRRTFPKQLYTHKFSYGVEWELTGVEVVNYDASAAVASVAVGVMSGPAKQTASASLFGAVPSTIREKWLHMDGEWWYSANY
tara:strand:- start:46084 stop:46497 length:414 start_codon:yes stop_codon:yes gene_type:complete